MCNCLALACVAATAATDPLLVVTADNTAVDASCRIRIGGDLVIEDADGNGVIHVAADNVTLDFSASPGPLRGTASNVPFEAMTGVGVRIAGHSGVTLIAPRVHGFRVAVEAEHADGLTIVDGDVSDGYAMRLRSTPLAEDLTDWLAPHDNDGGEWTQRYGAGIAVRASHGVRISGCRAQRRQNGLILDRVTGSRVVDNDFSFLSGWGVALWRSSDNTICRNQLDFCVRGYCHGVYNRGQDSAGLLLFEQCCRNLIAYNSATHGGDGLFGFGGAEALGTGDATPEGFDHRRKGNNDNVIVGNDFSYAAAHGLEMTFSFGNRIVDNRFAGNAICGIWGGFSQETLVQDNRFEGNGDAGYGLERGGVNIEHGAGNVIRGNTFENDACAVHLWTDEDASLRGTPWARANYRGSVDNMIVQNHVTGGTVGIHLRDTGRTEIGANRMDGVERGLEVTPGADPEQLDVLPAAPAPPAAACPGTVEAVGARRHLGGREAIVMGPYFPWSHDEPMLRLRERAGATAEYDWLGTGVEADALVEGDGVSLTMAGGRGATRRLAVTAGPGVHPYRLVVATDGWQHVADGVLVGADWAVTFFPWTPEDPAATAPPPDLEAWRAKAGAPAAVTVTVPALRLGFGHGGPRDLGLAESLTRRGPAADHFGMIARATLPMPRGRWRLRTLSDDGVRVQADGDVVIENWTHHGPTRDTGFFETDGTAPVRFVVEHFEIFGYAVLELSLEPAPMK